MSCRWLEESIGRGFSEWSKVRSLDSGECLVRLPFWDGEGDPIELTVAVEEGRAAINDTGSIAGILFSLGQDHQGTPAFKLLEDLAKAHNLEINFDDGLVELSIPEADIYAGIAEMAKVVLTMKTVVPHIRQSRRRQRSFGPRLRTKVARQYRNLEVFDLIQKSYQLDGATVSGWPIDFRWSVGHNGSSYAVDVVTADLSVSEPFAKAQKIVSLSLDTRQLHQPRNGRLRVVTESQTDNDQAIEALDFLRFHSSELDYHVFDLREHDESAEFYNSSVMEITTNVPKPWAELMLSRQT